MHSDDTHSPISAGPLFFPPLVNTSGGLGGQKAPPGRACAAAPPGGGAGQPRKPSLLCNRITHWLRVFSLTLTFLQHRGWKGGCGERCELSLHEYAAWWRRRAAGQEAGALYVKDWHFAAEFPDAQVRPSTFLDTLASAASCSRLILLVCLRGSGCGRARHAGVWQISICMFYQV